MSCTISTTGVVFDANTGQVLIAGFYNQVGPCSATPTVTIQVACPGGTLASATATLTLIHPGSYSWNAVVAVTGCQCGRAIRVLAHGSCGGSACDAVPYVMEELCCCPTLAVKVKYGLCNGSNQRLVTFITSGSMSSSCTGFQVQWNYGDGTLGPVRTVTSGQLPYVETHPYSPAGYTATLNFLPPMPGAAWCQGETVAVDASTACPDCATKSIWAGFLCPIAIYLLLIFLPAGTAMTVFLPLCNAINSGIVATGAAFLVLGTLGLAVLAFVCWRCVCAPLWKISGQLLIILGFILGMFTVMTPSICQLPPYKVSLPSYLIALGAGLLVVVWWQNYRDVCPLRICDLFRALSEACVRSVVACTLVFLTVNGLVPGACNPWGWGFMLALLVVLLILFGVIIGNDQDDKQCEPFA